MVKKCHPCQFFSKKMQAHPSPLHHVFSIGPFSIDFTTWKPSSTARYHYIIVKVDYFTKWVEAMPTCSNNVNTATCFTFNHIITRFDIPRSIVTDHKSHFCNSMMTKLATFLHFDQEHSSPYYPQANGQVDPVNQVLKIILQRMVGKHKSK